MTEKITNHKSQITNSIALIGVIALAAVRLLVAFRDVWTWDVGSTLPMTDVGPVGTAICDMLCVVTLVLAVIGAIAGRRKTHLGLLALWLFGAAGAMMHVYVGTGDLFITGNWIGATALGLAAFFAAGASPASKRMVLVAVAALGAAIGMEAIYQVGFQHRWTVQDYLKRKHEILQQHQWEEGSIEQQKFEVRLMQNEATGSVGLSNVFGTAACAVTLLGIGLVMAGWKTGKEEGVEASVKKLQTRLRWAAGFCAAMGAAALFCSFSKGAILAFMLVGGVTAMLTLLKAGKNVWRNVAFAVVMLGVLAVAGRWWVMGIQTTPGGERSLLFRGFYWQAAAKMIQQNPVTGIGPGRFQDMYMVLKNPLSPEDVAQPHNFEIAWISQLGLAGWAWLAMVGVMLWRSAGNINHGESETGRPRWITAIIAGVLAFGVQYVVQFAEMLPESAAMWAISAVLFVLLVGYAPAMKLNERWLSIGALAAAMAALLHSQIDMGLTNVSTAPLLMVVIGAAAGKREGVEASPNQRLTRNAGSALVMLTVVLLGMWGMQVNRAAQARVDAVERWRAFAAGNFAAAAEPAATAVSDEPRVVGMMAQAALMTAQRDEAKRNTWLEIGRRHFTLARMQPMHQAALWRGEAQFDLEAWKLMQNETWGERTIEAVKAAASLAPYDTRVCIDMGRIMEEMGQWPDAMRFYETALKLDEMKYLDPDSQLSAVERNDLQRRIDHWR